MGCSRGCHCQSSRAGNRCVVNPEFAEESRSLPNLVVFFADNVGWGDIFGAPSTRTPNLDGLARDGMRLLNWYSAAHVCSPSRSSLLTGRIMVRNGVFPMTFHSDAVNGLPLKETTLAEHLRAQGYYSGCVGKWVSWLILCEHVCE